MMTADQLSQIRFSIQNSMNELKAVSPDIRQHLLQVAQTQASVAQNELDHAREEGELNTQIELHNRSQALESKLRAALDRMKSGTFGICEGCDEEISFRRLQAYPVVSQCLECQSKQEAQERKPVFQAGLFQINAYV